MIKKFLFIHQWVKHQWNTSKLIELINKCPQNWQWLYRFHPSTDVSMASEIQTALKGIKNIEFEESTNLPLPCLLEETDFVSLAIPQQPLPVLTIKLL